MRMLKEVLPDCFPYQKLYLTATYARLAKADATNRARLKNHNDTLHIARKLGLSHLLPGRRISPADATLAVTAMEYATQHFFVPKTIADKV